MHFTREMYHRKLLTPLKVDTDEERADITTKAMAKGKNEYERFRYDIMNVKGRPAKKS